MVRPPNDAETKVIRGMVTDVEARCVREGIALEDFYRALLTEAKVPGEGGVHGVCDLFARTFRRLKAGSN